METTCSVEFCNAGGKLRRGLCNGHWLRLRRTGDVDASRPLGARKSREPQVRPRDSATCELVITRPSTGKQVTAVFDVEDETEVRAYRWCIQHGYVVATNGVRLHRLIMKAPPFDGNNPIDHINGDKLDNRRQNLRHVSQQDNSYNRAVRNEQGSSKYRGVTWEPKRRRWYAYQKIDGVMIPLGRYTSETEAAEVVAAFRASQNIPTGY